MTVTAQLTLAAVVRHLTEHPAEWRNTHLGKLVLRDRPPGVSAGDALTAAREALGVTEAGALAAWSEGKRVDEAVRELRAALAHQPSSG